MKKELFNKLITLTNKMIEEGVMYVPIPALNEADLLELLELMNHRLDSVMGEEECQVN